VEPSNIFLNCGGSRLLAASSDPPGQSLADPRDHNAGSMQQSSELLWFVKDGRGYNMYHWFCVCATNHPNTQARFSLCRNSEGTDTQTMTMSFDVSNRDQTDSWKRPLKAVAVNGPRHCISYRVIMSPRLCENSQPGNCITMPPKNQ
jgi:hypothetical protein